MPGTRVVLKAPAELVEILPKNPSEYVHIENCSYAAF